MTRAENAAHEKALETVSKHLQNEKFANDVRAVLDRIYKEDAAARVTPQAATAQPKGSPDVSSDKIPTLPAS
jgi:hypothetical protein